MQQPHPVHTIGHSNQDIKTFIAHLQAFEIKEVIDVRQTPSSRHAPHFNEDRLRITLHWNRIQYTPMGEWLGGRPDDSTLYNEDGQVQYHLMAQHPGFRDGLRVVVQRAHKRRLALMCSEADPSKCHRTLLIAQELAGAGLNVVHILSNSQLVTHQDLMQKLVDRIKPPASDHEIMVAAACRAQAARVAYVRKTKPLGTAAAVRETKLTANTTKGN